MERTNSSRNDLELDESLDLHPQSYGNFESELSILHKSNVVNNTSDEGEQQCSFHGKGITKLCDSVATLSNNCQVIPMSKCEDDRRTDISKSPKQKSNKIENSSEKKRDILLEDISSDDNFGMDSDEEGILYSDDDERSVVYTEDIVNTFDPSLYQATKLRSIQDPSLSIFEHIHRKLGSDSKCKEVSELIDCLEYLISKNMDINEKWIIAAEQTILILPNALHHILNISEYFHKLCSLVNITLDLNSALKIHVSMPTLIIRHLKIGLQLIEVLCNYNEDLSEHLIKHHQIHKKLINLFFVEHMGLSLKLNILRALDSSLNGYVPITLFLCSRFLNDFNGYKTLLEIALIDNRSRVCFLITSMLRKIQLYELLPKLNVDSNILYSDSELLLQECLAEIITIFVNAPILMGCPKRLLEARAQFEIVPALTQYDVYPTIYRLFDYSSFLNCITKLFKIQNCRESFKQNMVRLLQSLMDCDHGLRYLGCRYRKLKKLLEVLAKVNTQLKFTLVYKLQVLTLIDHLRHFWECNLMRKFKLDQMASVDILHDMFLLTQSVIGKYALVNVLTMGDNLEVILNFFKYMKQSRSKKDDINMMYALDLMIIVLENSEDVYYLKKYGAQIYELASEHNCFNDLIAWTFPVMNHSAFFHDNVSELCNIVKNSIDNCLSLNKTLITSLRVLKYLGVPNDETEINEVKYFVELKYKYTILQMYSCDMLENLLNILNKICDDYKQPAINIWRLTGNKAKNIISIIQPSMLLIRCIIILLIQSQGNSFKDLSPIIILLKLYDLMNHVPDDSIIREDATKVAKDIIKTLEAYVKIEIGSSMSNELIAWTLSSPSVFVPGLLLFCKLLPSPFPIKTKKALEKSIIATMISFRNIWINHLGEISKELVELITVLSSSKLLLEPMECLCIKISDLSISLCLFVSQSLIKVLIDANNKHCFNSCLDLLTKLCKNKKCATIKTAVLQILNKEKSQGNNEKFVQKICDNITINHQENSILFVQCLCDSDIIIHDRNRSKNLPRNSVPSKWIFNKIIKSLLSLFESHAQLSTISLALKTCMVIVKNDYGFYQFKMVLDLFPKAFYNIFNRLLQKWKKEDNQCVNTLTYLVQLLNQCIKNDEINTRRELFLSSSQLRECLDWSNDIIAHPLHLLKRLVQDNSTCCKYLINLIDFLNVDQELKVELIEPQLSAFDYLPHAFKNKPYYVIDINEKIYDNCSKDLYTKTLGDFIECNIEEVVSDLSDFSIKDKINDLFKIEDCVVQTQPIVHELHEPIITGKINIEYTTNKSTFKTNFTRHKVLNRPGTIERSDTYCKHCPNISRPQSLHVDDFVAMEVRSAQQQQPPGYKLPIQDLNIRLHERKMAYNNPYESHSVLHNWHAQSNALAHLHADYHQTISGHLETERHPLKRRERRQHKVEDAHKKKLAYSMR